MKKRIVREESNKNELFNNAYNAAKKAHGLLVQAAENMRDAEGEDGHLFQRFDSNANDVDDTIYIMDARLQDMGVNESHGSVMDTVMHTSQEDLNQAIDDVNRALNILDGVLGSRDIEKVPEIEKRLQDVRVALMDALPYNRTFKESAEDELYRFYEWLKSNTQNDEGVHVKYYDNEDGSESVELWFDDRYSWDDDVADGTSFPEEDSGVQDWIRQCKKQAEKNHWDFSTDEYAQEVTLDNRIFSITLGSPAIDDEYIDESSKKFVKESSNYNDKALKELMDKVVRYGGACQGLARNGAMGRDTTYDQKMMKETYNDIQEYAKPFMAYTAYDGKEEFEESGVEEGDTEWFDSYGNMKKHLPMGCILDCSSSGSVDNAIDKWIDVLNFHVPPTAGMSYLQEYGLDDIGPEDVDKYVLWIMCGNIKEEAYEFCRGGMGYDDMETSEYPDDMDDWTEQDWDNFQSEVAICHLGM